MEASKYLLSHFLIQIPEISSLYTFEGMAISVSLYRTIESQRFSQLERVIQKGIL